MPSGDETTNSPSEVAYVLPKYLRFARSLALVSGAALGIAAGAAVVGSSGCSTNCNGFCTPGYAIGVVGPQDAQYQTPTDGGADADGSSHDAGQQSPPDGRAGGGPQLAPHLPAAWLA